MNFLFHLHLSGNNPDVMTGNLMGDFVKGRIGDDYPLPIRTGIELHRRIDSFAQVHPRFVCSRSRIAPHYGLWRGVLVDLFYDHFLASEWDEWSSEPLDAYLERVRGMVEANRHFLPERMREVVPVIFDELIPSYRNVDGIARALVRMATRRVRRPNPLAGGEEELVRNYDGLRNDFREFMPEAQRFAAGYLGSGGA
ncbi:MAG TPA: ACP phosphodiesterase [Desulfuromonadaceae bacterium]